MIDTRSQKTSIETSPRGLLKLYYKVVLSAGAAVTGLHLLIGLIAGFGKQFAPYLLVLDGFLLLLAYIGFELTGDPEVQGRRRRSGFVLPLIGLHLVVLCSETGGLASPYFVLMLVTAIFAGLVFRPRSAMLLTATLGALHLMATWLLPHDSLLLGGWETVKRALLNGRSMSLEEITGLCMHSAFLFLGTFLAIRLSMTFRAEVDTLAKHATRDPLTGMPNRRGFTEKMRDEIERAQRLSWPISMLVVDLDFFKQVNDRYGHAFGDEVLSLSSRLLKDTVGPVDHLGRLGGEEFAVAAVAAEPGHGADLAARIVRRFREHPWFQMRPGLKVTCSIGVAVLDPTRGAANAEASLSKLLDEADQALYQVKENGRDNFAVFKTDLLRDTTIRALRTLK